MVAALSLGHFDSGCVSEVQVAWGTVPGVRELDWSTLRAEDGFVVLGSSQAIRAAAVRTALRDRRCAPQAV